MLTLKEIKKDLESNRNFIYWKKAIGLSFDDFSIIDVIKSKWIKKGKSDIGNYCIYLENGIVDSFTFDMDNKFARQHRLKKISR